MLTPNTTDEELDFFIIYAEETEKKLQIKLDNARTTFNKTKIDLEFEIQLLYRLRSEKIRRQDTLIETFPVELIWNDRPIILKFGEPVTIIGKVISVSPPIITDAKIVKDSSK